MPTMTIRVTANDATLTDDADELAAVLARVAERMVTTTRATWGSAGVVTTADGIVIGTWAVEEDTDE